MCCTCTFVAATHLFAAHVAQQRGVTPVVVVVVVIAGSARLWRLAATTSWPLLAPNLVLDAAAFILEPLRAISAPDAAVRLVGKLRR